MKKMQRLAPVGVLLYKGRPPNPEHQRRVRIRPGYRVSAWVAVRMKEQGDDGRVIEKTVIGFYGLKPPSYISVCIHDNPVRYLRLFQIVF